MFWFLIILSVVFTFTASTSDAIVDKIQFHWYKTIFSNNPVRYYQQFWNPMLSWANKYKDVKTKEPKFWGSTTIFVFVTDAWHLFKFIRNTSMFILVFLACIIAFNQLEYAFIYVISLRVVYGLNFTLFFDRLLEFNDVFGTAGKQNTPSNERNSNWNPND